MKTIFVTTDISEKLTQVLDNSSSLNAKIVSQMHAGVCHFFFVKKSDNSTREAFGTLNKELLENILGPQPETTQSEPVPNSEQTFQRFYVLSAQGDPKKRWRQYEITSLISMF